MAIKVPSAARAHSSMSHSSSWQAGTPHSRVSAAASAAGGSIRTLPEMQRSHSQVCSSCHDGCFTWVDICCVNVCWHRSSILWCSPHDGTPRCCPAARRCCTRSTQCIHSLSSWHDATMHASTLLWCLFQLLQAGAVVIAQVLAVESTPMQQLDGRSPDGLRRTFAGLLGAAALAFHLYTRAVHTHLVPNKHTERAVHLVLALYVHFNARRVLSENAEWQQQKKLPSGQKYCWRCHTSARRGGSILPHRSLHLHVGCFLLFCMLSVCFELGKASPAIPGFAQGVAFTERHSPSSA